MEKSPIETRKAFQSKCPKCQKELLISESQDGQKVKCPHAGCQVSFVVRINRGPTTTAELIIPE